MKKRKDKGGRKRKRWSEEEEGNLGQSIVQEWVLLDQDQVLSNRLRLLGSFYNCGINGLDYATSCLVGPICWCGQWFLQHFFTKSCVEEGLDPLHFPLKWRVSSSWIGFVWKLSRVKIMPRHLKCWKLNSTNSNSR